MALLEPQDLIVIVIDDDSEDVEDLSQENFNVTVKIEKIQDELSDTEANKKTCEELCPRRESSGSIVYIHSNSDLFDVSVVKEETQDEAIVDNETPVKSNNGTPADTSKELCVIEESSPEQEIEYLEEEYDENCIPEEIVKTSKKRQPPEVSNSYITDLKLEFPELEEDEELLIEVLARIMKEVKAPPLPKKYCIQTNEKFICLICGGATYTSPAAERHYLEKHGSRYLVCYACGATFRSRTNLYKHEKKCKAKNIDVVLKARAIFLGRKGQNRPYLDMYQSSWSPPRKMQRNRGTNMMKPEQKYLCTLCPTAFVTKQGLQSHMNKHLGIRPYRCDKCYNAYSCPLMLKRHLDRHENNQYICDICKRNFKSKATLIQHMDTHLPSKKYGCPECDRRYANKYALNIHVNKVHRKLPLPFVCQICSKRYSRMSVLKEHMNKEHGLNIMSRTMYLRKLPTMSEQDVLNAKIVMAKDIFANEDPIILDC